MHLILCGWSSAQLHEQRGLGSKGASPLVSLADLSVDWAERFFALIPLRHVLSKQICRREWRGPHVRRAQGHLAAEQCQQALESEPFDAWCRRVIPDVSLSRRGASATLVYMLGVAKLT